jgi:quercetin dioxygenase-like cupin family protein
MNRFISTAGEGKQINFRGTKMFLKVSKDDSEGKYSLVEMAHPPNTGPALHIHSNGPEAYYIIDGEYLIQHDKITYNLTVGNFVFVPRGVPHNYRSGSKGGKMLVIMPAGLEGYFEEVAELLKVGSITWDLEQKIAHMYGQEFLDNLKHWGQ